MKIIWRACSVLKTWRNSMAKAGRLPDEYYGAAEPLVRCGESHLSGLTEPLRSLV